MSTDNQNMVVSVGNKKIVVQSEQDALATLASQLPPEAAAMLASMQSAMPQPNPNAATNPSLPPDALAMLANMQSQLNSFPANDKVKISATSPGLKIELPEQPGVPDEPVKSQEQSLVRSVPEIVQRAMDQQSALDEIKNQPDKTKKLTVYECGVALGLITGKTSKTEVAELMKEYSRVSYSGNSVEMDFFYSDLSITIFFNDENIVREIQFGLDFRGITAKGLKIGDTLDKAIELYGQPRMKSPRGAIWNKFGVFCQNNLITCIRLQS